MLNPSLFCNPSSRACNQTIFSSRSRLCPTNPLRNNSLKTCPNLRTISSMLIFSLMFTLKAQLMTNKGKLQVNNSNTLMSNLTTQRPTKTKTSTSLLTTDNLRFLNTKIILNSYLTLMRWSSLTRRSPRSK